ncbi:TPA: SDR family oxidoreductase [Staphylococcus aureus]|nr:SDR family oxidoreductase [Staphylococcus aureus]HDE7973619.1 SDR family oxidoreductase [Staphylococcus aureus]HDE8178004.1 SDR family oxidoreductase [Staphylococcus aureus]HDE8718335.1 SDR family oxidoreductase [Staphylococcus aureus]HDE9051618.1 SDR family oxidoreductase [Staphylococcus aureus]
MENCVIFGANSDLANDFIEKNLNNFNFFLFCREPSKSYYFNSHRKNITFFQGSISNITDLNVFLEKYFKKSKIDILINYVGIMYVESFYKNPQNNIEVIDINIKGLMNVLHTSYEHTSDTCSFITISSINSKIAPAYAVSYSASKSFINTLILGLYNESLFLNKKQRFLNVIPGPIETKFTKNNFAPKNFKLLSPQEITFSINYFLNTNSTYVELFLHP